MSDTLKTDAQIVVRTGCYGDGTAWVKRDFARTLERDLAEQTARAEAAEVQLAGCLTAADGWIEGYRAKVGDYGWSPAYEKVVAIREGYDARGALIDRQDAAIDSKDALIANREQEIACHKAELAAAREENGRLREQVELNCGSAKQRDIRLPYNDGAR